MDGRRGAGSSTHTEDEEKLNEHGTKGQDPSHENAVAEKRGLALLGHLGHHKPQVPPKPAQRRMFTWVWRLKLFGMFL